MEVKPALALPDGLELIALEKMDEMLIMTVISTQESPRCPCCGHSSRRIHSRYTRKARRPALRRAAVAPSGAGAQMLL
jgi:hypothetical protein